MASYVTFSSLASFRPVAPWITFPAGLSGVLQLPASSISEKISGSFIMLTVSDLQPPHTSAE